jgi:hypothetical protein
MPIEAFGREAIVHVPDFVEDLSDFPIHHMCQTMNRIIHVPIKQQGIH